jgi:hypothetical protein
MEMRVCDLHCVRMLTREGCLILGFGVLGWMVEGLYLGCRSWNGVGFLYGNGD